MYMAIKIDTNGLGDEVVLTGDDAKRFVEETKNPTDDGRRAEHFRRSAETFEHVYTERSANELFRS